MNTAGVERTKENHRLKSRLVRKTRENKPWRRDLQVEPSDTGKKESKKSELHQQMCTKNVWQTTYWIMERQMGRGGELMRTNRLQHRFKI